MTPQSKACLSVFSTQEKLREDSYSQSNHPQVLSETREPINRKLFCGKEGFANIIEAPHSSSF
jgi:hypothetical protein